MKTIFLLALTAIASVAVYAFSYPKVDFKEDSEEGIQFFKGTWNETLQLAKNENKLIFLDIYATWCGPCKRMKKKTFADAEVGKFYNQNFINVAFDGELGDGKMLMQKYNLRTFPSILLIDENENVVERATGYHNTKQIIKFGEGFMKK